MVTTNKMKAQKLFAAVAVFAMVFAVFAAVDVDSADAAAPEAYAAVNGPIEFDGLTTDNASVNNLVVSYNAEDKTYYVSGTLGKLAAPVDGKNYVVYYKANGAENKITLADTGVTPDTTVTVSSVEYTIDVSGVVKSDKAITGDKYTVVENSNALAGAVVSGTDGAEGSWALADGVLTLTNYNGKEAFSGAFTKIVLVGDNTITLNNTNYAIATSANLEIMSVDGLGTLTIVSHASDAACTAFTAIKSENLNIKGITIDVTATSAPEISETFVATGIDAADVQIYEAKISAAVDEENLKNSVGIKAAKLDIKSCKDFNVTAGKVAINVTGAIDVAASTMKLVASENAILTEGAITITNASVIDAIADGQENLTGYAVKAASVITQSDSVLTVSGMYITGDASVNNATVTNNGDMIIGAGAKYVNKSAFVNNGVIGVYGIFENAAEKTVNNGTINTFKYNAKANANDFTITETAVTCTISVTDFELTTDGVFNVSVKIASGAKNVTVPGTVAYVDGKYTIEAANDDISLTVSPIADNKYDAYVYGNIDADTPVEVSQKLDSTALDTAFGTTVFADVASAVTVSGGVFENAEKGIVSIDSNADVTLVSAGEFSNKGTVKTAVGLIVSGKLNGNDIAIPAGKSVTLTGEIEMTFTYIGTYPASGSNVAFKDAVKVSGNVNALTIEATPATDANKGPVTIKTAVNATASKSAKVTLVEGALYLDGVTVGEKVVVEALKGTTVQIVKENTCTAGVIAIQDGATINMKVAGDRDTSKFGTLKYVISFNNDGFTYYGSLEYALANAAENAELTLNDDAVIGTTTASTVNVKKGITLKFTEKKNLTLNNVTLVMGDGAKFVLADGSKIIIKDSTLTGNVVYDVNEVAFKAFAINGDATITERAAKKNVESSITLTTVTANAGEITAVKGLVDGALTLASVMESDGVKVKSAATLVVAADAVFAATLVDDAKTTVTVDGIVKVNANAAVKGKVTGAGSVVLKDNVVLTFESTATADVKVANSADAYVDFVNAVSKKGTDAKTITVTAKPKAGAAAANIEVAGDILGGEMTVAGVVLNKFTVGTDAKLTVPKDATLSVKKGSEASTASGLVLVAGTINMKTEKVNDFGVLNYQITYKDGDYTVYTYLSTGVNNGQPGDVFTVESDMSVDNMTVPAGVTIIVAEGKTLTVTDGHHMVIGKPITTLGAATSGIQGTIALDGDAFVVVYNDAAVDMSKAKIVVGTPAAAAKNSQFTINFVEYATVYKGANTTFDDVKAVVVPAIDGYRFLGWEAVVPGAALGETDYEANLKADMIKVVFENVTGIKYYVDGNEMFTLGAPVYVEFGATITALADTGYTGQAQVNGKNYINVTSDLKVVTGSGVTAVEPTPIVPETDEDDGLAITDYLLIVLVVLIAIMAVMVAMKLMRS